jgi:hypothetical protein
MRFEPGRLLLWAYPFSYGGHDAGSVLDVGGIDRQHLGLVLEVVRHDDHRRRTRSLDVELNPPEPLEWRVEGEARTTPYDHAPIRNRNYGIVRRGLHVKLLVWSEHVAPVMRLIRLHA